MASNRPRPRMGWRILMGIIRVLAAAVLAVAASAALADLDIKPVEFSRVLPVVLTGEGIIYILMLGGGSVAAPILLLALVLTFALRAGIAVGAGALSPQVSGDLIGSAKFYYASFWPAAVAQVLLMAVTLRLIRPLIATRRRRMRHLSRPEVTEALEDERREEERREVLLEALTEAPDEPPTSPTVLEERQIGDLTEAVERDLSEEEVAEVLALPFDEEGAAEEAAAAEAEETASEPEEGAGEEAPLPPGVVDATPEALAIAEQAGRSPEEEGAPAPEEEAATEPEPAAAEPVSAGAPGEDTAPMTPVAPRTPEVGEIAPPENLQGMIDVIARAAGDGTDVRVWRTSDGRTVLAAVPGGTPAAGTAGHANALVSAHLEVCAWLGVDATCPQIAAGPIGAWALQAIDPAGAVILVMAARGDSAAGRLQLAAGRTAEAIRGMAQAAGEPEPPAEAASALPISLEEGLAREINEAARTLSGRFAQGWRAWRGPHRRIIAVHASPGADIEQAARRTARLVAPIERFADAVALEAPEWVAVSDGQTLLAMQWAERAGEPVVLSALTGDGAALGRVRWELAEIGRLIGEQ